MEPDPHIVVLAAGKGRRMRSQRPKVLHPVLFRPMVHYVLDIANALPHQSLSMVVGKDEDEIESQCRGARGLNFFHQEEQLGTAHAVKAVEPFLRGKTGPVLILSADVILLKPASLKRMLERHVKEVAACTIGTTTLAQPHGYGRILRELDGRVIDVREEADCSGVEKTVNEVNAGLYFFQAADLFCALDRIGDANALREYYLTDAVRVLAGQGRKVNSYSFGDPAEVVGIDDRAALCRVEAVVQDRVNKALMHQGVTLQDPKTTWIDPRCRFDEDVRVEGGCVLINATIEREVCLESGCRIIDSLVGAGSHVKQGTYIEGCVIGSGCTVGPYAHLRPASRLGAGVKIGNFVELKASTVGAGSKASHLSCIGDAEVGRDVNLGCGFITCNYDGGPVKRKTIIEDGVFIGSDCQAVAPVCLGNGSYIAAGTTVTEDVPPQALAISRGRQTTKQGYARRYRKTRIIAKAVAESR